MESITTALEKSQRRLSAEILRKLAADHTCELRRLSDLALVFLNATEGDRVEAEGLLDSFIDLVFEGGVLQTWRYRILLAEIWKGL